ncbi:MAG TPA: diaminopimelate decarboxylase [Thermomicrobiales bacterium]
MLWPETTTRSASGELMIGGCSLVDLAERFGTPLYVFDEQALRTRAQRALGAFRDAYSSTKVVYAGKAFICLALIRLLRQEGLGLDVVSGGELYAALAAGMPASEITFHGNNKSEKELREALSAGVGLIAVDNHHELTLLARLANEIGTDVPILLRLTPGIDVHTHDKIKTGVIDSKFGFPLWTDDAERAVATVVGEPRLTLVGYHAHLGSQMFDVAPVVQAIEMMMEFAANMRDRHGVQPRVISPGGGWGIAYEEGQLEVRVEEWASAIARAVREGAEHWNLPLPEIVVEPGRWIVGPSAVALYRVGSVKEIPGIRRYVAVDGGMADNLRPALYGARYTAALANRAEEGVRTAMSVVGKYCESGDILIQDAKLPVVRPGDLLAVASAGAYSLPLANNYNHACRPAVVLVREGKARVMRRREEYADVIACDEDFSP